MKRAITVLMACVLGGALCGSLWAQDSTTEPSEDYVLEEARKKLADSSGSTETASPAAEAEGDESEESDDSISITITIPGSRSKQGDSDHPYFPFVVSFVPGLAFPFGVWDTSLSGAAVGALTGSINGAGGAGVFNIVDGELRGALGAGVFNLVSGDTQGFQGAGVFNIAGDVEGFQGAGVFNIAEDAEAFQGAGVFNIAADIEGVQAAGVFNIADSVEGLQVAGVVNVADSVDGAMIGLVNIADELDGVAIGLVNIIGNGINDVSVDYQFATDAVYATLRTGTPALYAAFYAGQPADGAFRSTEGLTMGAGLGHRFRILFLTADIEACSEMPMDEESMARLSRTFDRLSRGLEPDEDYPLSFASIRASFGFGERKGFGVYLGVKTDIEFAGAGAVPDSLKRAFSSTAPYSMTVFGRSVDIWPKLYLGIKY